MTQYQIPVDDIKVFEFLKKGETDGVFQLESPGMRKLLKDMYFDASDLKNLTPEQRHKKGVEFFERLIAVVSLYRPGPMDEIPKYITALKGGQIYYDHEYLKDILKNTYGILVYQEQIMFAVRKLAGFSAGQADTIRKAMGKKKMAIMEEYGRYFISGSEEKNIKGCIANDVSEETAKNIWDKMVKFASYAFNKSHAACYATIGFRTAWLSYYYPVEFMTGMLNSYIGNTKKIAQYVKACSSRKIKILNPHINKSDISFSVEIVSNRKKIRFGLAGLKGVGLAAAEKIVKEREIRGEFTSLKNFLDRMAIYQDGISIASLEALITTGAFDDFNLTRASLIHSLDILKQYIKKAKDLEKKSEELRLNDFNDIFGETKVKFKIPDIPEFSAKEICLLEEDYIGFFLTHPIKNYKNQLKKYSDKGLLKSIESISEKINKGDLRTDDKIFIAGLIRDKTVKSYKDKNGKVKKLLSFVLDDGTGTIRVVMFGNNAIKYDFLTRDNLVVYLTGRVKSDEYGLSCICQTIELLSL